MTTTSKTILKLQWGLLVALICSITVSIVAQHSWAVVSQQQQQSSSSSSSMPATGSMLQHLDAFRYVPPTPPLARISQSGLPPREPSRPPHPRQEPKKTLRTIDSPAPPPIRKTSPQQQGEEEVSPTAPLCDYYNTSSRHQPLPPQKNHHRPWVTIDKDRDKKIFKVCVPIVIEQYKLVFFWIPKVGSTEWKALFMKMLNISDWRTRNGHDRHVNGITYSYLNHFNQTYIETMLNDPCWTRAAIVRDPKDRIVSAWLDKIVKGGGKMLRPCCRRTPQEQKEQQAELEFQASIASAANPLTIDPQVLAKKRKQYWDDACVQKGVATLGGFVQRVTEWCPDTHWNAQSKLIGKKFTSTLNFVGHLDTIADDAKALLQRIGAWEEHGVTGWGQYGNESMFATKSGVHHKTSNTTSRQEDPYDHRLTKYYTPEIETMVETLYKSDYATPEFRLELRKINFAKHDDSSGK
jgi:hypothetical protein